MGPEDEEHWVSRIILRTQVYTAGLMVVLFIKIGNSKRSGAWESHSRS